MKRILNLLLVLAMALSLVACGSSTVSNNATAGSASSSELEENPADLTGQWKQVNSASDESYQAAIIEGNTIEIYWVDEDTVSFSLYWAGTFVAPETADEPYTWDSENDHDQTDSALLASGDDTKTITYKGGQLSYSASALGTTQTVKLEKAEGVLDAVISWDMQEDEDTSADISGLSSDFSIVDYLDYGDVMFGDLTHNICLGLSKDELTPFEVILTDYSDDYYDLYVDGEDTGIQVSFDDNNLIQSITVISSAATMRGGVTVGSSLSDVESVFGETVDIDGMRMCFYNTVIGELVDYTEISDADVSIGFFMSDDGIVQSIFMTR